MVEKFDIFKILEISRRIDSAGGLEYFKSSYKALQLPLTLHPVYEL